MRDTEVIASQEAHLGAAREGVLQLILNQLHARKLHECCKEVRAIRNAKCAVQLLNEMRFLARREIENVAERVFDRALSVGYPILLPGRDHPANTSPGIVLIAVESRDNVDV